jgi:hypothetical protein
MVLYKLCGGRVKRTRLLIPVLALVMLVACTSDGGHDHSSVKYGGNLPYSTVPTGPFRSARSWIRALNQQGVPCRRTTSEHPPPVPFLFRDLGYCRLDNGDTVTVWIVGNATRIMSHLAGNRGPGYVFYRDDWLALVPVTAPANVVSTIRQSFHAAG